MYKDMALLGGPASSYSAGPPLALYDLLGQKGPPISYAYSCDMSVLGEEDEEDLADDTFRTYQSEPSPSPHDLEHREGESTTQDPNQTPDETLPNIEDLDTQPTLGQQRQQPYPPPSPPSDTARPPITQRETFPQPSRRPNWQTIRYQTTPGRTDKAQLEAWVSGWSAAVGELGDDTYCACADSTAASASGRPSSHPPSLTLGRGDGRREQDSDLGNGDDVDDTGNRRHNQPQGWRVTAAAAADMRRRDALRSVSFVCHNCARQPSPAVIPDQDFVFPPASGAGRVALKCKLAWKRIFGKAVRWQSPSQTQSQSLSPDEYGSRGLQREKAGEGGRPTSTTPLSRADGLAGSDEREEYGHYDYDDDDEVDVDRLSGSSRGGRPRDDIAERQARLRRAQRLLRKGSRALREAG